MNKAQLKAKRIRVLHRRAAIRACGGDERLARVHYPAAFQSLYPSKARKRRQRMLDEIHRLADALLIDIRKG